MNRQIATAPDGVALEIFGPDSFSADVKEVYPGAALLWEDCEPVNPAASPGTGEISNKTILDQDAEKGEIRRRWFPTMKAARDSALARYQARINGKKGDYPASIQWRTE